MVRYTLIKCQDDTIYSEEKGYTIKRLGDTLQVQHTHTSNLVHIPWTWVREAQPYPEDCGMFSGRIPNSSQPDCKCRELGATTAEPRHRVGCPLRG